MNFTREPIIETIITPKEGYKLIVRNSKGGGQEEYSVDAVEVVSFGHSFFFRSLERPKSFLVPVSDYEIVESKETRVVLKNVNVEHSIKIGGGREAPVKTFRETLPERAPEAAYAGEEGAFEEKTSVEAIVEQRIDKKRDRRRHRRRRGMEERHEQKDWGRKQRTPEDFSSEEPTEAPIADKGGGASDEAQVSSPSFSTLFPPPPTLISETIGRYKDQAFLEGYVPPRRVEEEKPKEESHERHEEIEEKKDDDDNDPFGSQGTHLSRSRSYAIETTETQILSSNTAQFNRYFLT